MKYVLFNHLSGSGDGEKIARERFPGAEYIDMLCIPDYKELLSVLTPDDKLIVLGGDGTLNIFANAIRGVECKAPIYFYPAGTGNDFLRDIGKMDTDEPVLVDEYIRGLPTVTINGEEYSFINAVGYGIDGYCCEVGDKEKLKGKKPNYASIAIFGMLFHYKPCDATVIVDGEEYNFKRVWISPVMHGRYYGGGMMAAPEQVRGSGELTVMLFHDSGKLSTLMTFPKIFTGEHIKSKIVTVLKGKEITVRFSEPRAAQVDGETMLGVTELTAHASRGANVVV